MPAWACLLVGCVVVRLVRSWFGCAGSVVLVLVRVLRSGVVVSVGAVASVVPAVVLGRGPARLVGSPVFGRVAAACPSCPCRPSPVVLRLAGLVPVGCPLAHKKHSP